MLKLFLGRDWTANRDEILKNIAADIRLELGGRILMVPELISHDTERRLAAAGGDTTSRFAEVLSFTRLARRVADMAGCGAPACLDNGGRVVAMAAAVRQLHSRLKAYAAVETRPEFLAQLVDGVDEFKRCCITAQDLRTASKQTEGSLAQKLEELSLIFEAYDSLCQQGKRDPRDQMNWLLEQLEDGSFGESHVFYIDGFPDFTRQHLAILEHLIRVSPCVSVSLNCDMANSNALAFEKPGTTAAELIRCAKRAGVGVEILYVQEKRKLLTPVLEYLFQGNIQLHPELQNSLCLYRTESVYRECMAAAERVMEFVADGCRYRDISVVCTDIAAYQAPIRLVFNRCGIPLYLSGTEDILRKSVVAAVLSAMDAALGGFEQRDVLRYLKSVLSPLTMDDCDRLENYSVVWGINGKQWVKDWDKHPEGLGRGWTLEDKKTLQELNACRVMVMEPLLRLYKGFRNAKKLKEQVQALYAFFEEIHLEEKLDQFAREMDLAEDNRSAQILNQLWDILLSALEQLYDVLGEMAWDSEVFSRLFTLLLSQYDVGTIPPVLDAVMAGPISAMRCQEEKHLIVLGALEGSLPGYGGSTGVLSDQERVALRELGVPLTGGAMEGLQAEFAEIYGVFCGAAKTVTVSCPVGQPSFVFQRLVALSGGERTLQSALGAVLVDKQEAGAYLARWNCEEEAARLGLTDEYMDICRRRDYGMGIISKENIRTLYGEKLNLSASQIDCQGQCRLNYFLQYGLRAKERKEITVDPAEFGTYVHAVLEQTARQVMELGGFHKVSLEETLEIAREHSNAYARERFGQLDTPRLRYLFRRNGQELEMVIEELWEELSKAAFAPVDFELSFGEDGKMPAIPVPAHEMEAQLRGFVDRVDAWKENGQNFYRVVDYKTGKKSFDYCDVLNGIGLQMLIYLFALEQGGEVVLGHAPVPAGVQYFPARVNFLSTTDWENEEEVDKERAAEWKRKGLILDDREVLQAMEPGESPSRLCCTIKDGKIFGDIASREQFGQLKTYVFRILSRMVDEIASGKVEPDPYTRGSAYNACRYCPYKPVCHQENVPGRRNYKAVKADKFWEDIGRELKGNG